MSKSTGIREDCSLLLLLENTFSIFSKVCHDLTKKMQAFNIFNSAFFSLYN